MPRGHFILEDHGSSPLVMAAAGIGLTPIMSMIDSLANSPSRNPEQIIICMQLERSPEEHSMKDHIDQLVGDKLLTETHVFYTRHSGEGVVLPNTNVHTERPTIDAFKDIVGKVLHEAEYYFCGPEKYMNAMEDMLDTLEVKKDRRHSEIFGPQT